MIDYLGRRFVNWMNSFFYFSPLLFLLHTISAISAVQRSRSIPMSVKMPFELLLSVYQGRLIPFSCPQILPFSLCVTCCNTTCFKVLYIKNAVD